MGGSQRAASGHKQCREDMTGVVFITIGVGPRTAPDRASHIAIVAALVGGLVMAKRASWGTSRLGEDGCTPHHPGRWWCSQRTSLAVVYSRS